MRLYLDYDRYVPSAIFLFDLVPARSRCILNADLPVHAMCYREDLHLQVSLGSLCQNKRSIGSDAHHRHMANYFRLSAAAARNEADTCLRCWWRHSYYASLLLDVQPSRRAALDRARCECVLTVVVSSDTSRLSLQYTASRNRPNT